MGPALWRLPTQWAILQRLLRFRTPFKSQLYIYLFCEPDVTIVHGSLAQEYADKALLKNPGDIAAFVELHIEQGPALEAEGKDIGIVEAIMAPSLVRIKFTGKGGHGGGMPMSYRYQYQIYCNLSGSHHW